MKRIIKFLLGALCLFFGMSSCSSDHNHYYDLAVNSGYYYYDGYYYADPEHYYRYDIDPHHYYYGRLEWKDDPYGYAIVLRENPYYGLIVRVDNPGRVRECLGSSHPHDDYVMVRFSAWSDVYLWHGERFPRVVVDHIYYSR